ncbi:DUF6221 family protein [Streptomyces sp. TLI_171]|uniref:DUF6221 family protein n=1 Tax=Streptomyces sp. TLI_171 TaxID=1938859 RepID=UPI000C18E369|nr:DUF6221 family protein [Streptomyces sp. TLI_171]RKE16866.1 hypothetical protein BX266_0110 [Streptomyces sp. TLI_171]
MDDVVTAALVAFVRDCLAEDERVARAASPGPWVLDSGAWPVVIRGGGTAVVAEVREAGANAAHLARHDPQRVLVEVHAKRQLLDAAGAGCGAACRTEHSFDRACALHWMGPVHERDGVRWLVDDTGARHAPPPVTSDQVLRLLALSYARHPAYRREWAPGR